jgi:hypothetical protein
MVAPLSRTSGVLLTRLSTATVRAAGPSVGSTSAAISSMPRTSAARAASP